MYNEFYVGIGHNGDMFFVIEYNKAKNQETITKVFYNKDSCLKFIDDHNKKIMEEAKK